MENEKEIIKACATALQAILTTAQQTLFYLNDKEFEIEKLRESFKLLDFPTKTIDRVHLNAHENSEKETYSSDKKVHLNALKKKKRKNNKTALNFNTKEINSMPKEFKKKFKLGLLNPSVREKENGSYEIRCRINKIDFSATAKTINEAKEKFIKKLREYKSSLQFINSKPQKNAEPEINKTVFKEYTLKWLEIVKKPYVKDSTYKSYLESFNHHLFPQFGDRDLKTIKQLEIQTYINEFNERQRTAKKLYQLLSAVFDYAVADEIIVKSPMTKIRIPVYEQVHGVPLSRKEEKTFIESLKDDKDNLFLQAYVFMIYTGLRRSELSTVKIDDTWVHVTTAKVRKGKSEKARRIPISPMLKSVLPLIDVKAITQLKTEPLTRHFKKLCPTHHLHDLRHTFITRCQECGIQREIVSLWAGHAADSSITSVVYTHLEHFEGNQLKEIQKLSYNL